jgi:hypothetical protein
MDFKTSPELLIHVPQFKNAADAQILTLGASLQLNYPQVKEVVIVSHDAIFNYLHQTLQRQGQNTYKVTLSRLSQEFKVKYQKSISEILQSNKLPKSTLSFIQKNCAEKIKVEMNGKEHFLSLKSVTFPDGN